MNIKKIECNLCGSKNYETIYKRNVEKFVGKQKSKDKYTITEAEIEKPDKIFKCNSCDLAFAEQTEHLKYYAAKYAEMIDEEYVKEEKGRRLASIKILKRIEKYKKNGRLLDVGCATGFLLDEARHRKWEVRGIEMSKWAADYARQKLNLDITTGPAEKTPFPDEFFDVIVMIDVLEHLTNPKHVLLEIRRILKNDGILYISTPNIHSMASKVLGAKWWGINKYHLYYFSINTFKKMCDACGMKVKSFTSHVRIFSLSYWVQRFKVHSRMLFNILSFISRIDSFGKRIITVNLHDQVEAIVIKERKLDFLVNSASVKPIKKIKKDMKVFVVLPAYNAERTLKRTVADIPKDVVTKIILTDDNSSDETVKIAKDLGLEILQHATNMGYGANQKTCYNKALEEGADIIVMVHPDYQYDPTIIPKLIEPIQKGKADAVFGSRMMKGGALEGGMPMWKHNVNILLTAFENIILGTFLTEYHSGFRAYSADLLRTINYESNSNKFVFDTEIIVQTLVHRFKIDEVPICTRYFSEASNIRLLAGLIYGLEIIKTMFKYVLHSKGIFRFKQFE